MVDEERKEVKESKAVAVKKKVSEATAKAKLELKELQKRYVILEEKFKLQSAQLKEKIQKSESLKQAKSFWVKLKEAFEKLRTIPAKKIIVCPQGYIYGYVKTRKGDTVVVSDACYLEIATSVIDVAETGKGVTDKVSIYGLMFVSDVQLICDVSPEAIKVI